MSSLYRGRPSLFAASEKSSLRRTTDRDGGPARSGRRLQEIKVTPEAQDAWVALLLTGLGNLIGSPDCTPGYYNNEGERPGREAGLNVGYPAGPSAYSNTSTHDANPGLSRAWPLPERLGELPLLPRNVRVQPRTAFSRFPPVHGAGLKGQLRVQKLWGRRQRSGTVVVVRKPMEAPHDPS
jgi:hypothetical protein